MVCGGYDRGECLTSVEAFDFAENVWSSSMKPMMTKRGRFGLAKIMRMRIDPSDGRAWNPLVSKCFA